MNAARPRGSDRTTTHGESSLRSLSVPIVLRPRGFAVLLVSVLLCVAAVPPAVGAAPAPAPSVAAGSDAAPTLAQQEDPTTETANNSTVRHRDPSEVQQGGNLDEVESNLENSLSNRLVRSNRNLREGDYATARGVVGSEYDEQLQQYREVVSETDTDPAVVQAFEQTQTTQRDYVTAVADYQETYAAYQDASEAGDRARARTLARDLETAAQRTANRSTALTESYQRLENATGRDFGEEIAIVEAVAADVADQQATVRDSEFTETRLQVTAGSTTASFADPAELSGTLTTADGDPLANQRVRIRAGEQTTTVETDDNGEFDLDYRPTTAAVGSQTLAVRYVPTNNSTYLGSGTSVALTISQTEPTVRLDSTSDGVGYGDPFSFAGRVSAGGVGAANVPVVITIDGRELATVETNETGAFNYSASVPASIAAGEHTARVALPLEEQALVGVEVTRSVGVERTPTDVSVSQAGLTDDGDDLVVSGTFTTADGRPVGGETLDVLVDGTSVATTTTDADGTFRTTVPLSQDLLRSGGSTVRVVVTYGDGRTNLESARSDPAPVALPADEEAPLVGQIRSVTGWLRSLFGVDDAAFAVFGVPVGWLAGVGVIAVAAALLVRRRRTGPVDGRSSEAAAGAGATGGDGGPDGGDAAATAAGSAYATAARSEPVSPPGDVEPATYLEAARTALDGGDAAEAAEYAYAAARRHLVRTAGISDRGTHREFLRHCREVGVDTDLDRFELLTDRYERAAFSARRVTTHEAERAVEAAAALLSTTTDDPHAAHDGQRERPR